MASSVPRFYQALLSGIESYRDLGKRIIREIKTAHAFRQIERVRELSRILINVPIKEHQLIAEYYLVWCECRERNYQSEAIERIIEHTRTYKAQALLTRGTFDLYQGRPEPALYFYSEALKSSPNIGEFVSVSLAIAQLKGIEGFNKSALKDLESLTPLLKHADARLYYDFLNSYACELAEAGRKYEARNIIRHVIASPLALAYPEWRETAEDLREANRSFVIVGALRGLSGNVLSMPAVRRDQGEPPAWAGQPAPVVNYQQWKKRMAKKKKNGNKPVDQMTESEMMIEIMNLFTGDKTTNADRRRIYFAVMKAYFEPDKPDTPEKPDDENPGA